MMDFAKSLLDQIQKASGQSDKPWGDANPLVIIGLTEAILDLGLTEEQMWNAIRSYGRQLAAQVHPDRNPSNVSVERQRQILSAFDILDNRETFSKALAEFKHLKAEDRRENRILRQSLNALKGQLFGFESSHSAFLEEKKSFELERQEFERLKSKDPLVAPALEKRVTKLLREVEEAETKFNSSRKASAGWKRKFETLMEYLVTIGEPQPVHTNCILAFEARWVAIASVWPFELENPSPIGIRGEMLPSFLDALKKLDINKEAQKRILKNWVRIQSEVGTPGHLEFSRLPVGLSLLEIRMGKPTFVYGNDRAVPSGYIIGSIPSDKIPIGRPSVIHSTSQEVIFESLSPYLVPGGILVSIYKTRGKRKASWSMRCPDFRFSTRRVIVGVGV